jgi:hypothetical protein
MGASWRSRFIEGGIQPEAGDEGDWVSQLAALVEQFERGVSAIGYGYYLPVWVPVPYDQKQLPGPFGYLLVSPTPLGSIALGRSQSREER